MLEFYKGLYDNEWIRRAEIRQAASLPTGVLTLLAGVLVFYVRSYSFPHGWVSIVFFLALAGAIVAFLFALYMLLRALFGPKYKRIPWPSQIRDYQEGLTEYYRNKPGGDAALSEEFDRFLIDRYVDAANRNAENNVNAGEYLYKANRAVAASLIFVVLCALPVVVDLRLAHVTSEPRETSQPRGMLYGRDERTTRQFATEQRVQASGDSAGAGKASCTAEY
jgi:hypothetical protein